MNSSESHRQQAAKQHSVVRVAVLTISDTRTTANDTSGKAMTDLLTQNDYAVAHYSILKDEPRQIVAHIQSLADSGTVDAILTNGGTGIAKRDSTVEAIESLLEKKLVGFGEIFRMLSYEQVGAAAMMSRAVAGTYKGMMLFSTPGSTTAVTLAMEKLILPELRHIIWEMER